VARAADPAAPGARDALGELCEAYWYPIYGLIRRRGRTPQQALDLTQDYFARLLEKGTVGAADPLKGRFRAFLQTDCAFFLADQNDRESAQKRGGGRTVVSIEARDAERRFQHEPMHTETPERLFERDWAHSLISRVFDRLERQYAESGRAEIFSCLKPILTADPDAATYTSLAGDLGTTEGSLRVAVHRLRNRFATELRREVAETLNNPSPEAIEDELRELFAALSF
jgi:RNA polymerase sigma-70 factor (ECF subfamily)